MKIGVLGAGYVGLVTGTCLAESGNDVVVVDVDEAKVATLRRGQAPIYEPGLEELLRRNVREERLTFTTDLAACVKASEAIFIAVGTPGDDVGRTDLKFVEAAARGIARSLDGPKIVILKSTVPVGTADRVRAWMKEETAHPVSVVSNPEFLKEGTAVEDFMKPDRVVIGADDPKAVEFMSSLYAPFVRTGHPILSMDNRSAEMVKYAANAMLACRISFMNEIASICERLGANVEKVRVGIGTDERIGFPFLFPGLGYGGSCFPKDVQSLMRASQEAGIEAHILQATDRVNREQRQRFLKKIETHFKGEISGKTFAAWGLAFKPNTDDMREAPSVTILEALLGKGARVKAFDPVAVPTARKVFGDRIAYANSPYQAAEGADALLLLTEWNEFRRPDPKRLKGLMRSPVVFDGRNIFDAEAFRREGFVYIGVGQ